MASNGDSEEYLRIMNKFLEDVGLNPLNISNKTSEPRNVTPNLPTLTPHSELSSPLLSSNNVITPKNANITSSSLTPDQFNTTVIENEVSPPVLHLPSPKDTHASNNSLNLFIEDELTRSSTQSLTQHKANSTLSDITNSEEEDEYTDVDTETDTPIINSQQSCRPKDIKSTNQSIDRPETRNWTQKKSNKNKNKRTNKKPKVNQTDEESN